MLRYFTELNYNGTNYHGWQMQPNAVTVQEKVHKAFSVIMQDKIEITGAGRTDTGVHAEYFTAHFDSENILIDTDNLIFKINRFLPYDIAVQRIYPVPYDLHARFSAVSRTYEYRIARSKLPFHSEFTHYIYGDIDLKAMNKAVKIIMGYNDFTSFSKLHTDTKTNICKISEIRFYEVNNILTLRITSDRFLRNMVRAVTGTLLDVGAGKTEAKAVAKIIEGRNRSLAGVSVPAKGLFLTDIRYPVALPYSVKHL